MAIAAFVAMAGGLTCYLADAWPRLESDTIDMRFSARGASKAPGVVVVAIDDKTFSQLRRQWPFPRRLHASVIDRLAADRARAIAYDVQFTEPTDRRDDLALYEVDRPRSKTPVVLATTEVDRPARRMCSVAKKPSSRLTPSRLRQTFLANRAASSGATPIRCSG